MKPLVRRPLKIFFVFWLPALSWMAFIFFISSISGEDLPDIGIPNFDKVMHAAEYLILGVLLSRALHATLGGLGLTKTIVLSIIIASLFAGLDEWHQQFVPERSMEALDLASDVIGLVFGALLYKRRIEFAKDNPV